MRYIFELTMITIPYSKVYSSTKAQAQMGRDRMTKPRGVVHMIEDAQFGYLFARPCISEYDDYDSLYELDVH